jgi:alpha-1,3-glucosyltransferase
LFAALLNFKHIFLYAAPAYFFFLLKTYVRHSPLRLAQLAFIVVSVFAVAFAPFVLHIPQILKRLFPFGRGLTHAYWAPNIWALYNLADCVFSALVTGKFATEFTKGLVHDPSHAVLPNVRPSLVLLLCIAFSIWLGQRIWKEADSKHFLEYVSLSCYGWVMLGWHVHEKAVLMFALPLL